MADCLGRSHELCDFFDKPAKPGLADAYALIGMKKEERTVFAPSLEVDQFRHDVAQTTVSFSGHGILAPSATEAEARREVGRRIIRRLAQQALSRIIALDGYIAQIEAVFSHPEENVSLTHTPLRVSRMGIKPAESTAEPVNEIVLAELSLGSSLRGAIALVRCTRAEIPPRQGLAGAERFL